MAGRTDREARQRQALLAFDRAVDELQEQAGFLEASGEGLSARYVGDAYASLARVRLSVHEIEANAADTTLRGWARRRLHTRAVTVAEAGLADASRVAQNAEVMSSPPPRDAIGPAIRSQTARAVAWTAEKWSGSPVVRAQLGSARVAAEALRARDDIIARGQLPSSDVQRRRRVAARTASIAARGGILALAAYGAWDLLAMLF